MFITIPVTFTKTALNSLLWSKLPILPSQEQSCPRKGNQGVRVGVPAAGDGEREAGGGGQETGPGEDSTRARLRETDGGERTGEQNERTGIRAREVSGASGGGLRWTAWRDRVSQGSSGKKR